jgi:hypothetical protein
MDNADHTRIEQLRREELRRLQLAPRSTVAQATVHCTELPPDTFGGVLAREWNFYIRSVAQLVAAGHEGRWVLIHGEAIVGLWNSEEEANGFRLHKFAMQPVLMKQICLREPVLRGGGHDGRCHS